MTTKLPTEEWDFRNLPEDTDLQTLIEYEYLRSSPLRPVIVKWHEGDFQKTQFANSLRSSRDTAGSWSLEVRCENLCTTRPARASP